MIHDKRALRTQVRALRDAFVATLPSAITAPAELRALFRPGMTVASYIAVGSEADPAPLADAARRACCVLALPHVVDRATPLRFLAWDGLADLTTGPYGLSQPLAHAAEVAPDLVLTPLLAFDPALFRLGQGAGHYDRAFSALPAARRIGVAWAMQRVAALPLDPWDLPLHAIVTERGWIER